MCLCLPLFQHYTAGEGLHSQRYIYWNKIYSLFCMRNATQIYSSDLETWKFRPPQADAALQTTEEPEVKISHYLQRPLKRISVPKAETERVLKSTRNQVIHHPRQRRRNGHLDTIFFLFLRHHLLVIFKSTNAFPATQQTNFINALKAVNSEYKNNFVDMFLQKETERTADVHKRRKNPIPEIGELQSCSSVRYRRKVAQRYLHSHKSPPETPY